MCDIKCSKMCTVFGGVYLVKKLCISHIDCVLFVHLGEKNFFRVCRCNYNSMMLMLMEKLSDEYIFCLNINCFLLFLRVFFCVSGNCVRVLTRWKCSKEKQFRFRLSKMWHNLSREITQQNIDIFLSFLWFTLEWKVGTYQTKELKIRLKMVVVDLLEILCKKDSRMTSVQRRLILDQKDIKGANRNRYLNSLT